MPAAKPIRAQVRNRIIQRCGQDLIDDIYDGQFNDDEKRILEEATIRAMTQIANVAMMIDMRSGGDEWN